jgi:release factor glutamine methyltransferase
VAKATKTMTSAQALTWGVERLRERSENANLDSELLLRHVLGCTRVDLYAQPDRVLSDEESAEFLELVGRREQSEPVQYLTGVQSFRALELRVGPGVLIPRPETEMVVERALELIRYNQEPLVADMGVGSGAIALSIAKERPDSTVWGVDNSPSALEWAMRNRRRAQAYNVNFVESDLYDSVPPALKGKFDLIVANPPYLSVNELAQAAFEVRFYEPEEATVAGPTGLEVASQLVDESVDWLRPGGWLVLETWPGQAQRLKLLMSARYVEVDLHEDLSGATRIAEGRKPL